MADKNPFSCYDRRYLIELLPPMATLAILAVLIRTHLVVRDSRPWIAIKVVLAAAVAYTVVVTVASIRRLDELQQRIQLQAIALSFAATGVLVCVSDALDSAGLPRPSGFGLWVFMCLVWVAGVLVFRRRYR